MEPAKPNHESPVVSGTHPPVENTPHLVGPNSTHHFNMLRAGLIPVACWRVDDFRFRFQSSFVLPGTAREFMHFASPLAKHPGASLSLFGHADPVGNDDYNKHL